MVSQQLVMIKMKMKMMSSLLLLLFLLPQTKASANLTKGGGGGDGPSLAKEGCKEWCGNVRIPFPFGMGKPANGSSAGNCYLDESYEVECINGTVPPHLKLKSSGLEVLNISFDNKTARLNIPLISWNCLHSVNSTDTVNLGVKPFFFSATENRFMSVACDNIAELKDLNDTIIGGCVSMCKGDVNSRVNSSCYGINCCQTTIPQSLRGYKAKLVSTPSSSSSSSSCAYASFVEQEWFASTENDPLSIGNLTHVPAVVRWHFNISRNGSFESFQIYLQDPNCFNYSLTNLSYVFRCSCPFGYQGNPYIPNGCKGTPLSTNIIYYTLFI